MSVEKGFSITCGVILALLFAFVVLPLGACVACGGATVLLSQ